MAPRASGSAAGKTGIPLGECAEPIHAGPKPYEFAGLK